MTTTRQAGEAVAYRWKPLGIGWKVVGLAMDRPHTAEPLIPASDLEQVIQERDEAVRLLRRARWESVTTGTAISTRVDTFLSRLDSPNG